MKRPTHAGTSSCSPRRAIYVVRDVACCLRRPTHAHRLNAVHCDARISPADAQPHWRQTRQQVALCGTAQPGWFQSDRHRRRLVRAELFEDKGAPAPTLHAPLARRHRWVGVVCALCADAFCFKPRRVAVWEAHAVWVMRRRHHLRLVSIGLTMTGSPSPVSANVDFCN
ncbi:hypothetical protein FA95DRAFT_642007 [Auriscalpium vulgare]|uniref:Uncharacterized protein n=1 Tax=Auriscalpium vulgare TaxID=40419 RepID=A0ACB8S1Y0_9AGAM|nr:hypothetical protein FA95DRAFT_642007 [Auriscalpium vulgare]